MGGGRPRPARRPGRRLAAERRGALLCACLAVGSAGEVVVIGDRELNTSLITMTGAVEIAVHGWDIAATCGGRGTVPPGLASELLPIAALLGSPRHPGRAVRRSGSGRRPGLSGRPAGGLPRPPPASWTPARPCNRGHRPRPTSRGLFRPPGPHEMSPRSGPLAPLCPLPLPPPSPGTGIAPARHEHRPEAATRPRSIRSPSTERPTTTVSMPVLAAGAGWPAERTARGRHAGQVRRPTRGAGTPPDTRGRYAARARGAGTPPDTRGRYAARHAGRYAGGWRTR